MPDTMFFILAYGAMVVALAGWVTFRWMYRPWRMSQHSAVGRHLMRTADSMIALIGVSLIAAVVPIPRSVMQPISVLILAWLAWVAWERVVVLRREKRSRTVVR